MKLEPRLFPWWDQEKIDKGVADGSVISGVLGERDVFVSFADRSRALNGDVVAVELYPESQWRRIKRSNTEVCLSVSVFCPHTRA